MTTGDAVFNFRIVLIIVYPSSQLNFNIIFYASLNLPVPEPNLVTLIPTRAQSHGPKIRKKIFNNKLTINK